MQSHVTLQYYEGCLLYLKKMELNREHFHAIIFYNFRHGLTQLNTIFGDEAPSRTSVYRWYGEFNQGRISLVVPETIDAMRQLILEDRHVIYREIETTLGISGTSIHLILHARLI